jgi:hypothetical protein
LNTHARTGCVIPWVSDARFAIIAAAPRRRYLTEGEPPGSRGRLPKDERFSEKTAPGFSGSSPGHCADNVALGGASGVDWQRRARDWNSFAAAVEDHNEIVPLVPISPRRKF